MKFRASKTNYYCESAAVVRSIVVHNDFFLINAGSYLDDKVCTKHQQSDSLQVSGYESFVSLFPNSLSRRSDCTHNMKHRQVLANPKMEYRICSTITMKRSTSRTTGSILRFFHSDTGLQVIAVASKIIYHDRYGAGNLTIYTSAGFISSNANDKKLQNSVGCQKSHLKEYPTGSTKEGFFSRKKSTMLLDSVVGCGEIHRTSQPSEYTGKADDACLSMVRYKKFGQEVKTNDVVLRLAHFLLALIRSENVLSLFSSRNEHSIGEQTDFGVPDSNGSKRKEHSVYHASQTAKKQHSEHLVTHPYFTNPFAFDSAPRIPVDIEPKLDHEANKADHDCSVSFDVDGPIQKYKQSSRKDRNMKKKMRKKRRRSSREENHSSEQRTPEKEATVQSENLKHSSKSNGELLLTVDSTLAMKKALVLGDVDNELTTARNSFKGKIVSNRNAYVTTKRYQGTAQSGIQNNIKMKWQSWNAFRHDHQDQTSSLSTTKQKSQHRLSDTCSSPSPKTEERNSLIQAADSASELGQPKLSHEKLIRRDYKHQLSTNAYDEYEPDIISRSIAVNDYVQHQSAGENPFQQHRNQQASEQIHVNVPKGHKTLSQQPYQVKVLCSEAFIEFWGDVVAVIVSGEWMNTTSCGSSSYHDGKTNGCSKWSKIIVLDSPLLNCSGIDMEVSHNCCFLVILASHLQSTEKAKNYILKLAVLAALERYAKCYIFFYLDAELTSTMTKNMVKIQFATTTSSIHVICKTATLNNLAASIAQTILSLPDQHSIEDHLEALNDRLTVDRTMFMTTLLPVASVGGSIRCLTLARSLLPIGSPYFEILMKNQKLRQKILITILCHETTDALTPTILVQLTSVLWYGRQM